MSREEYMSEHLLYCAQSEEMDEICQDSQAWPGFEPSSQTSQMCYHSSKLAASCCICLQ